MKILELTMFGLFKKKVNYKFKEPENTACIVCDHVMSKELPILYASHDSEDGCWQFLCGQDNHAEVNIKVISLKQATEIDETINDLFEMPLGIGAERETITSKWEPFRLE